MSRAVQRDPNRKKWHETMKEGMEGLCNSGAVFAKLNAESAGSCGIQTS